MNVELSICCNAIFTKNHQEFSTLSMQGGTKASFDVLTYFPKRVCINIKINDLQGYCFGFSSRIFYGTCGRWHNPSMEAFKRVLRKAKSSNLQGY